MNGSDGQDFGDDPAQGWPFAGDPVDDPALAPTAVRVRAVLTPGGIRPQARDRLRAKLVTAAAAQIAGEQQRAGARGRAGRLGGPAGRRPAVAASDRIDPPGGVLDAPRRRSRRPRIAVWAAATAAAVAAGVLVTDLYPTMLGTEQVTVQASSELTGAVSADPAGAVRVRFDHALDHVATEGAITLQPAADVRTSWQGDTLVVSPVHGLAPNSAYRLSIDGHKARTAQGTPLGSDLRLAFGTAPAIASGPATAAPAVLDRTPTAAAAYGSEAVVTVKGALLLTAARGRTAAAGGLTRVVAGGSRRVAQQTDAICVSRSGQSVAFLGRTGTASSVVFADGNGTPQLAVPAAVDAGSPLGWIDDSEVTFVSGGRLTAVDRQGHRRTLPATGIDAAHGSVVVAPGGRYAYLRTGTGPGRLYDLKAATTRELAGVDGDPAFTADGAGMVWFDRSGAGVRVHYAATSGGPTTTAPLPVTAGRRISDLAVSPDGSQFVYSVTGADRTATLVLAALPSGVTLARSTAGAGESPNWSPTGRFFTVLATGGNGRTIETVRVPASVGAVRTVAEGAVSAFATAQISGDTGAQAWLSDPGVLLPQLPPVTRAAVLWALPGPGGTTRARVRLTVDPGAGDPYALQAEESITLGAAVAGGLPKIRAVTAGQLAPIPAGPQLLRADDDAVAGSVRLTFDSDLDAATVRNGIAVTGVDGTVVPADTRYDSATRTIVVRPSAPGGQGVVIAVGAGLHDMRGASAPAGTRLEIPAAR
jgi:hypothetical protein